MYHLFTALLHHIFLFIVTTKDPHYLRHYSAWMQGEIFHALAMYRSAR